MNHPNEPLPQVSIVLPTYNGAKYLRLSLESCLNQTYSDFELIAVDDCSKDNTPEILAEFAARDARIRVLRHETNKRLPTGLNTGHLAARGQFLTWTSDDNLFRPTFLERMVGHLQAHPEVGFVYSDYAEIDDDGLVTRRRTVPDPETLAVESALGGSFLYRRTVFEQVGLYDPACDMAEDYDYWLRCLRQTRMEPLHEELYDYRFHQGSLTLTQRLRQAQAVEVVLRKNLPHLTNVPPRLRALGWLRATGIASRRRDVRQTLASFLHALRASPSTTVGTLWRKLSAGGLGKRFTFDTSASSAAAKP